MKSEIVKYQKNKPSVRRAVTAEQSTTLVINGRRHEAEYCCDKRISYPYWSETLSKY
jgi:hypothetical protein